MSLSSLTKHRQSETSAVQCEIAIFPFIRVLFVVWRQELCELCACAWQWFALRANEKQRAYCVCEKRQPYNMFETIYCLLLPCQGVKTPAEYWTTKNLNDLMRKPSLRLIRAPVKRLYVDGHHIRWIFCRLKLFYIVFCFGFICKSKRSKKWIQLLISAQHRIYVVKFIRFSLEVWLVGQLKYGATIEYQATSVEKSMSRWNQNA